MVAGDHQVRCASRARGRGEVTSIADIDYARLYRDHRAAAECVHESADARDARAVDLADKAWRGRYAQEFIAHMDLDGVVTALDVGCGPGTISLLLAEQLGRVVGLDRSQAMLDVVMRRAAAQRLRNVRTIRRAWEDDWDDVPECDIVVAPCIAAVEDLAGALQKLHAKARLRVYLTHIVGGRSLDRSTTEVVGRGSASLPDYIYVLNILHGMGIHPRLDYIQHDERTRGGDAGNVVAAVCHAFISWDKMQGEGPGRRSG